MRFGFIGIFLSLDTNMSKVIYSGLESSGKSLRLAIISQELVLRNSKWNKITGVSRPIISNMRYSQKFHDFAHRKGVELLYWKNLDDLIHYEETDVICDEVGNYFDARSWTDLSLDARRWLTQGAKSGIEFYGGAQDFSQIDRAFRRLVQTGDLHHIVKIFGSQRPAKTKPRVKRVWGLCLMRSISPRAYDEDRKEPVGAGVLGFFNPSNYFAITKSICSVFDTNQKLVRSDPLPLRHTKRVCEFDYCGFAKVSHV